MNTQVASYRKFESSLSKLMKKRIRMVGKPAGSTNEIAQALDRGKEFLGTKVIMKGIGLHEFASPSPLTVKVTAYALCSYGGYMLWQSELI